MRPPRPGLVVLHHPCSASTQEGQPGGGRGLGVRPMRARSAAYFFGSREEEEEEEDEEEEEEELQDLIWAASCHTHVPAQEAKYLAV